MREQHFPYSTALFGEPAWDILLDLYAAQERDRAVAVTSSCVGACVPGTTALRWLGRLERHGLVERAVNPTDARTRFVQLTPPAVASMTAYLARVPIS